MASRTDLYSIVVSYANKNNSPYISINSFLDFLEQYSKAHAGENPEWLKWAKDNSVKFWAEMSALVEDGRCELLADTDDGRIYVANYYPKRIQESYQNVDADADIPFHNEESLKIILPESQIKPLYCDSDLFSYLSEPQTSDIPILRLNFPDSFGSALALASMIPRRVTEIAIIKIRNYLRKGGNREYFLRKLIPQLQGRESTLKDMLNRIQMRPLDCYREIEEGGEFSSLFWAHFAVVLKTDIKRKKEHLHEDIAAFQSACVIDTVNGFFKALALKRRERELAFKSLESQLAKPPFLYTLDQICKFTNAKGLLLLSLYTENDLETWLKKKTTESEKNALPVLLVVHGGEGERLFALKNKIPALCLRLLTLARVHVKDALDKHWRRLLLEYRTEPAMESNEEFEKTLFTFAKKHSPLLTTLLDDPKLSLVYNEVGQSESSVPLVNIFSGGQLLPYSSLLLLQRKDLLTDVRLMIPLWYSMPILSAVIAFFKNLLKKKNPKKNHLTADVNADDDILEKRGNAGEIRVSAKNLETLLVPSGYTIETYMEELETRWSRLIDKQARANLIEDVKSLVRDNLRRTLRVKKRFKLTQEVISQMAKNIINNTPSLAALSGRDSLVLYMELYLLKLLRNLK